MFQDKDFYCLDKNTGFCLIWSNFSSIDFEISSLQTILKTLLAYRWDQNNL